MALLFGDVGLGHRGKRGGSRLVEFVKPPVSGRGVRALLEPARGTIAAAMLVSGCSSAPPPPPAPPLDAGQVATTARTRTRLTEPVRILFDWSLSEPDARFSGRGVARVEPPYRARLDLFLPNGETIARAALVDDDLRIPAGVREGILPPSHLLWGVLGVFRPGVGAALLGADEGDGPAIVMRYGYAGGREIHYGLRGRSVERVDLLEGGHVVQQVSLTTDQESRYPAEAVYRDLGAFRELRISRESVEVVEPYPPDIWTPGR